MGYRNAQTVHVRWAHLQPAPFRLLTWMALRTMDGDTEPTWSGTREELALGLGHTLPDEPAPDDDTDWARAAREHRRKALSQLASTIHRLVAAGAIAARWGGYRGAPSRYLLNVSNLPQRADTPERRPVEFTDATGDNPVESPVEK